MPDSINHNQQTKVVGYVLEPPIIQPMQQQVVKFMRIQLHAGFERAFFPCLPVAYSVLQGNCEKHGQPDHVLRMLR